MVVVCWVWFRVPRRVVGGLKSCLPKTSARVVVSLRKPVVAFLSSNQSAAIVGGFAVKGERFPGCFLVTDQQGRGGSKGRRFGSLSQSVTSHNVYYVFTAGRRSAVLLSDRSNRSDSEKFTLLFDSTHFSLRRCHELFRSLHTAPTPLQPFPTCIADLERRQSTEFAWRAISQDLVSPQSAILAHQGEADQLMRDLVFPLGIEEQAHLALPGASRFRMLAQ